PVESLPLHQALSRPLFHESGHLVLQEGERLDEVEVARLLQSGIRRLYDLGEGRVQAAAAAATALAPAAVATADGGDAPPEVQAFLRDRRAARLWRDIERVLPRDVAPERMVADPKAALRN